MKTVNDILETQSPQQGFPIRGQSGYGGEQDGSSVVLMKINRIRSRAIARKIIIPDYIALHWARYCPGKGWEVVVGWWSDQPTEGNGNPFIAT